MSDEWNWWVGHTDERYTTQCDTRDEAVEIAKEEYDGAYIVEAKGPAELKLSSYFSADRFLESADEQAYDNHADEDSGDPIFDVSSDEMGALQTMIRMAIDEWQELHDLKFKGFKFQNQRNEEYIGVESEE